MKCNHSRPGFELESPCPFPTTITITPRAPPLYKCISPALYSRKGDGCCVWEMSRRQGQTAILTQVLFSTIAALLFLIMAGVAQPWDTEGPKPSVWSWFSLRHPVSNFLEPLIYLVILFSIVHLLSLFFLLFTQVHHLIDGSVEGQYITVSQTGVFNFGMATDLGEGKLCIQTC